MAYQDIFRKIKDNIYIDKKIQIYNRNKKRAFR